MSDVAIRAENLGKKYRIGERERYVALRDILARSLRTPARLLGRKATSPNGEKTQLWALRDVSFEIRQGEVVGIIGRNGAGKSTLLKILARVTKPTQGFARVKGRVGTLLEVGTGFHPELTGRENVFLSGAILGMRKAEIRGKFDEIVEFAGVEKFIDTPLKHYSSGMQMRLAFAVAAHLETEILLIDEVLAVGDSNFQKKCMQKVGSVAKQGRTALFVSHSMAAVVSLCSKAVLLESGVVTVIGRPADVLQEYLSPDRFAAAEIDLREHKSRTGSGEARFIHLAVKDADGEPSSVFNHGDDVHFEVTVEPSKPMPAMIVSIGIRTLFGVPVLDLVNKDDPEWSPCGLVRRTKLSCVLKACPLYPGTYLVTLWLSTNHYQPTDYVVDVLCFRVEQGPLLARGFEMTWQHGLVHLVGSWTAVEGATALQTERTTATIEETLNK